MTVLLGRGPGAHANDSLPSPRPVRLHRGMPARFETVLFDLDGTLLDHFAAIHRAHSHVRRHYGRAEATREEVMRAIGGGLPAALKKTLGPGDEHRLEEALVIYRAYWDATMLDDAALLPGARELLVRLTGVGVRCAVFTNKHGPRRAACASTSVLIPCSPGYSGLAILRG